MRAEKRKKNAPKELARLKQALGLAQKGEAVMSEVQEIATVVPADKIKKQTDVEMGEAEGDGEWSTRRISLLPTIWTLSLLQCMCNVYLLSCVSQKGRWTWTVSATRKPCWMIMVSILCG